MTLARLPAAGLALALALPPALGAGRATKQADGGWTEQVTEAWLHSLERGDWPLARFVDDAAGLVVIDYNVDSGRENFVPYTVGRRLCGEKLTFTYLLFRSGTDRKLRLDAVMYLDGGMQEGDSHKEEVKFVRTELRRQRATDCAGKSTTVPDYERLQF